MDQILAWVTAHPYLSVLIVILPLLLKDGKGTPVLQLLLGKLKSVAGSAMASTGNKAHPNTQEQRLAALAALYRHCEGIGDDAAMSSLREVVPALLSESTKSTEARIH